MSEDKFTFIESRHDLPVRILVEQIEEFKILLVASLEREEKGKTKIMALSAENTRLRAMVLTYHDLWVEESTKNVGRTT